MPTLTLTLLLTLTGPLSADVIRVAPGDSVQDALDRAQPGDTVLLASGVHRERVVMDRGGEYGRPVTLEGEPGAIIDGSDPVDLDWQPAPDVAPGAYRAKVNGLPFTVTAEGKIITMLREDRVDPERVQDKQFHWPTLFRDGVRDSGWEGVKALALYFVQQRELLVRFKGDLDPRTLSMTVAPRAPCVWITGADRCVVRGLTLRNAAYGVLVDDSLGTVVEGCTLGPVDYGVWLDRGSDRCTVRFNEIFMDPYSGADPYLEGAWDNWLAHKRGGHYDRYGVQIRSSVGGHEVHDNHIHDTWDGIEDVGRVGENVALRIHHNYISNISDDGLEPNGAEEDCEWHDNIVERCICGFRIKAPKAGPLYAYRNIFFGNKEDYRNFGEVELKPAVVYVYHNTSTANVAIQHNKVLGIGTPNYHYLNNLFWCAYWWGNAGDSVDPNWTGDYNVYVRRGEHSRWDHGTALAKQLGLDEHSLFTDGAPGFADFDKKDVSLAGDSLARGQGTDLAKLLGVELPGLAPGESPDAGALQFGEPMPKLPRSPESVDCPGAGAWPGPEAKRLDPWTGPNLLANGGFEEGFEGWSRASDDAHVLVEGDAAEGGRYVTFKAESNLHRRLTDLEAGRGYVLVYYSRRSSIGDLRVIVRNQANSHYIGQGTAAAADRWRRSVIAFEAPDAQVSLELSPRSPGRCDIDGLALYKAR